MANKFFTTKEQHLAFRRAFALAVQSPHRHKGPPDKNGYRSPGWITASHMILQNLVRGLPLDRGFSPLCHGFTIAIRWLVYMQRVAAVCVEEPVISRLTKKTTDELTAESRDWRLRQIAPFLEPLGNAFTAEDLAKIVINKTTN